MSSSATNSSYYHNTLIIAPNFNYVTDYKYDDIHPNDALWDSTKVCTITNALVLGTDCFR